MGAPNFGDSVAPLRRAKGRSAAGGGGASPEIVNGGAALSEAGHAAQLLARRLLAPGRRFAVGVVEAWRQSDAVPLHGEVVHSLQLLLEELSAGRLGAVQVLAESIFFRLAEHGATPNGLLRLVDAFEDLGADIAREAALSAALRQVGRFLRHEAVAAPGAGPNSRILESTERVRSAESDFGLIGSSAHMLLLRSELQTVAQAAGPVLLIGESGTGKELVAQALHQRGRDKRPFVAVNCAALPPDLVESELFGHERGAFTGSREAAAGLMRTAQDGTIFLDEISEMPMMLQAKLLRVLEQRTVRPVGGVRELPMRARVVAATNRDPALAVSQGRMRADLYYRLCVHAITLPPLRERSDDIPELCEHFLQELRDTGYRASTHVTSAALERLQVHDWPGNVRELKNVIEHAVAVARGEVIDLHHLPRAFGTSLGGGSIAQSGPGSALRSAAAGEPPVRGEEPEPVVTRLEDLEREHILRALAVTGGNKTHAAKLLGLSRHQLYVRLERLALPTT